MSRILVTGSSGQLGAELKALQPFYKEHAFCFTDTKELDITDHVAVDRFVEEEGIQAIINCAAYTAVDMAESEVEQSDRLNHLAVANFSKIAKKKNLRLLHVSTDYVFDGDGNKPYLETDKPNPKSVYGRTKWAGELAMQKINPSHSAIVRTSWLYSRYGNNFVKTMLRLGGEKERLEVVHDQLGTPTHAEDLASVLLKIMPQLSNDNVETYHYTNEGFCSWYDFARAIFEIKGIACEVFPVETSRYPTAAKRPFYSALNKEKIKEKYALVIPHWRAALKKGLENIEKDLCM